MYPAQQMQVYGRCLSADDLLALKETLHCSDRVKGYLLFAESPADSNGGFLDGFCGDMTRLMSIYESENAERTFFSKPSTSWITHCASTTEKRFSAMGILHTAM